MMRCKEIDKTSLIPLFQSNDTCYMCWFCVYWLAWCFFLFSFFLSVVCIHLSSRIKCYSKWLITSSSPFAFAITKLTWCFFPSSSFIFVPSGSRLLRPLIIIIYVSSTLWNSFADFEFSQKTPNLIFKKIDEKKTETKDDYLIRYFTSFTGKSLIY